MSDFASQIKEIQRSDPVGKAAWWRYCDKAGGKERDPTKHDPAFLEFFINEYEAGAYLNVTADSELGDLFKNEGFMNAPTFKAAWHAWQVCNGSQEQDPSRVWKESLVQFLEFIGQQGAMTMQMMDMAKGFGKAAEQGKDGKDGKGKDGKDGKGKGKGDAKGGKGDFGGCDWGGKGDGGGWGGKGDGGGWGGKGDGGYGGKGDGGGYGWQGDSWQGDGGYGGKGDGGFGGKGDGGYGGDGAWDGGMSMVMPMMDPWGCDGGKKGGKCGKKGDLFSSGDPAKDALVQMIKDFQRTSEDQKQAWWAFCDAQEGRNRDPARYPAQVLQMFASEYDLWSMEPPAKRQKGGGKGPVSTGDPVMDELCRKIKDFQRQADFQKQAWWSFCDMQEGKNRDPARYPVEVLQMFCSEYGL